MTVKLKVSEAKSYFTEEFPPAEFSTRRNRIFKKMESGSHALLRGSTGSNDRNFRQHADFFYCCGIEIQGAFLLMSETEGIARLFIPHRPADKHPDEVGLGAEDAAMIKRFTGVDEVHGTEALNEHLNSVKVLYTLQKPGELPFLTRWTAMSKARNISEDPWDGRPSERLHFNALLKTRFPNIEIREIDPIIDNMRVIKSPCEIKLMREAGRLSALAVKEAMLMTSPGMMERELSANAVRIFMANGATGESYPTIVASGRRMQFGHYSKNNCVMKNGEIVLMDGAPDYNYYTSDIGRVWPVNGKYAPWQRELYGYIVEYHKTLLSLIKPGMMAEDILKKAAKKMAKVVEKTKFSKKIYKESALRTLDFKAHLSHPVGLSVHDIAPYKDKKLKKGMVFSVDPMMWIPEEELYIRCEDTIVVTNTGLENLTADAPLGPDEIEKHMT